MQNFKKTSYKRECPCTLKRQEEIIQFTTELVKFKKPHIKEYQLKKLVEEVINSASREITIGKPQSSSATSPTSAEKEKLKRFVDLNLDNLMIPKPVTHYTRTLSKSSKKKPLHLDFMKLNITCSAPKKPKFESPLRSDTKVRKYLSFQENTAEESLKHKRQIKQTPSANEKPSRIPKLIARRKLKPQETLKSPEILPPSPGGTTKKFNFSMKLPQEFQPIAASENKVRAKKRVTFSLPSNSFQEGSTIADNSGTFSIHSAPEPAVVIDNLLGALMGAEAKRAEERRKFEAEVIEIQEKMDKLLNFIRN